MENVFIIGNGFDLDLGLPTKYSDFAASDFWPTVKTSPWKYDGSSQNNSGILNTYFYADAPKLGEIIQEAKNRETWFDLEAELLDYSKEYEMSDPNYTRFSRESPNEVKTNVEYYNKLRESLNDYILNVEKNHEIRNDCTARNVLEAIASNGCFWKIYSFNYTDLNSIATKARIDWNIEYTHLHGKVSDRSIILGVDETNLRRGYEIFHKSSSQHYHSHDLYNSLATAREIVIFGLSFGSIDYSYFDRFFRQLTEGESINEDEKKYITIFTKDDNSRLSIITNLRNMGINIQRLYAQSHFQIICTSDDVEKNELSEFYKRLEEDSHVSI